MRKSKKEPSPSRLSSFTIHLEYDLTWKEIHTNIKRRTIQKVI